jgi:hypothetical protein
MSGSGSQNKKKSEKNERQRQEIALFFVRAQTAAAAK